VGFSGSVIIATGSGLVSLGRVMIAACLYLQQVFVVGAHVKHDGQHSVRCDATRRAVQREFADRDAHAVYAQVAQAQDTAAVSYHWRCVGCEV